MFKKLTDFSYKRSGKEALGFYLAYFLIGLILGGIGGAVDGILSNVTTFSEGFHSGLAIGAIIAVIYSLFIAFVVVAQRKLYKNFGYIVLALLSGILAAFGGSLLGLIIPAFLTTRGVSEAQQTTV